MLLGNEKIRDLKLIKRMRKKQLQPASYDLTLDHLETIDKHLKVRREIRPGETLLATTKEKVELPKEVAAFLKDKSSYLRLGLTIGQGFIDPGFKGTLTVSVFNGSKKPVKLESDKPFCQIVFMNVENCSSSYDGHYQNQKGIGASILQND